MANTTGGLHAGAETGKKEGKPSDGGASTNVWDFARAALVLAALVVLTLLVIKHYGQNAQRAATILGIAAPVLAAIVGGTLGYYTGNNTGKASGEEKGEVNVKQHLTSPLAVLDDHIAGVEQPAEARQAIGELKTLAKL
jgi:hypothetical protein